MNEALIAPCGMNCALCVHCHCLQMDLDRKRFRRACRPGRLPRGKHCLNKRDKEDYGPGQIQNLPFIRINCTGAFLAEEKDNGAVFLRRHRLLPCRPVPAPSSVYIPTQETA